MQISEELMKRLYPRAKQANIRTHLPYINEALVWYNITSAKRVAAFLAVCGHETGQLTAFTERGNAAYFQMYEYRKDLGNDQPGDGPKYKGRGAIQLTGRHNYTMASKDFGVDFVNNPDLVLEPKYIWKVSGWYWAVLWKRYGVDLNGLADKGDLKTIQLRVNGGPKNGWEERKALYDMILPILEKEMGSQLITQKKKSVQLTGL
ncbi:glycoside hydrolase family 19 protein [Siphonobacter sp.]|uniref:glycoside hydrolase family 19 protein n=1 Tax=Siphonobacter sp. TaxID=1869184 RepID=UPI003B3B80FE